MSIIDDNLVKISELQEKCQWAATKWMEECFMSGHEFRILEAFRTQKRQNDLYAQGRSKPGMIVTYTLNSKHTARLALDIAPINGKHREIMKIGEKYGITHPLSWDPPHYEFDKALPKPPPVISIVDRIKGLQRRLLITKDIKIKDMILRLLDRIKNRL